MKDKNIHGKLMQEKYLKTLGPPIVSVSNRRGLMGKLMPHERLNDFEVSMVINNTQECLHNNLPQSTECQLAIDYLYRSPLTTDSERKILERYHTHPWVNFKENSSPLELFGAELNDILNYLNAARLQIDKSELVGILDYTYSKFGWKGVVDIYNRYHDIPRDYLNKYVELNFSIEVAYQLITCVRHLDEDNWLCLEKNISRVLSEEHVSKHGRDEKQVHALQIALCCRNVCSNTYVGIKRRIYELVR